MCESTRINFIGTGAVRDRSPLLANRRQLGEPVGVEAGMVDHAQGHVRAPVPATPASALQRLLGDIRPGLRRTAACRRRRSRACAASQQLAVRGDDGLAADQDLDVVLLGLRRRRAGGSAATRRRRWPESISESRWALRWLTTSSSGSARQWPSEDSVARPSFAQLLQGVANLVRGACRSAWPGRQPTPTAAVRKRDVDGLRFGTDAKRLQHGGPLQPRGRDGATERQTDRDQREAIR